MKSFGMFSIIRGLCRAFSNMGGGLLANMLSIQMSYGILGVFPLIMLIYTVFFYYEERVSIFKLNII
jgi:hypothetical protein